MDSTLQAPGTMCDRVIPFAKHEGGRVRLLTARMCRGEEAAFSEFHAQYSDRLYRFLLVITRGGEGLAGELCQATMVKVVRSIREFEAEEHLWNWIARIARNCFIDALRKQKRSPETRPLTEADFRRAAEGGAELELIEHLMQALNTLDPTERALIEEFYFDEKSHHAIADERQMSSKAVESKLARLRGKLRMMVMRKLSYEA
jgi:RNA polymerase sigma factor (sigma-70 family)